MVIDNIVLNKAKQIELCVSRVKAEYQNNQLNLFENLTKQDSIVLNLQRASDAAIDLVMHLVRILRLGVPQTSRDAFELLHDKKVIDGELLLAMKRMVGFRNIPVHQYEKLSLAIVQSILEKHLDDFEALVNACKRAPG